MSWGSIGWYVAIVRVSKLKTLCQNSVEAPFTKAILKTEEVILPHLIHNDPNYKFGFSLRG